MTGANPGIRLCEGDLPADLALGPVVAIDTETLGLNPHRDRLCLVQLSAGDGLCHLVRFTPGAPAAAPRLCALLADPEVTKLFHFARFDVAVLLHNLGVLAEPVWCTKIASKIARTYTDRHGLKELCRELLQIDLSKEQQSSDWGADVLSEEQLQYAAADVLYLHRLQAQLLAMLRREGRADLAEACFRFVPHRARLDLAGWAEVDVLAH